MIENREKNPLKDYHEILKQLNRQYEVQKRKLDHLYDLVETGEADQYDLSRMKDVKQELTNLQKQIQDAKDHLSVGELSDAKIDELITNVQELLIKKQGPQLMKALFSLIIHKVVVYKSEIVVYFMVSQGNISKKPHTEGIINIRFDRAELKKVC